MTPHEPDDDPRRAVPMAVFLLVALVVVLAVGFAVTRLAAPDTRVTAADERPAPRVVDVEPAGAPLALLTFAPGSSVLPADANDLLEPVVRAADEQPDVLVLVSAYHEASSAVGIEAELARSRALAVRHALEASGLSGQRVVVNEPRGAPAQAHVVELRLVPN